MPRLYEEAALLLLYMAAKGLILHRLVDPRVIVKTLAETLETVTSKPHTHAEAAAIVLDTLSSYWVTHYDPAKRDRLIAMIGSFIGNTPALRTAPRSK